MDDSTAPSLNSIEPAGLESPEVIRIANIPDQRGGVNVIKISDLCPFFDVSGTSSRLAVCVNFVLWRVQQWQEGTSRSKAKMAG